MLMCAGDVGNKPLNSDADQLNTSIGANCISLSPAPALSTQQFVATDGAIVCGVIRHSDSECTLVSFYIVDVVFSLNLFL